jgi:amino acid adenylation domain-containing protein
MLLKEDVHTVHDLIDFRAEAQPDRGFLMSPETERWLTFRELQEQVRQLCGLFQSMGLAPGDKIAFLMDNGLFTAQLFLGTMYGGFVAVPLNVRAGVSQLSYTLENCDAKLVFVGRSYEALLKDVLGHVRRPVQVVPADADFGPAMDAIPTMSHDLPRPGADDAAMLIYTSGSTGQPKGPIHTHRSVLAHGRNSAQAHKLNAADRSLLVLPLYHINAECVTLIPTLLSGGSVILPHGFAVSEFWNWIDDYGCTWSAVVPTIISQLLDWKDPKAESRAEAFARIRFLRSSSAPLSPSLHREFIEKFHLPLIQAMGSSEAGNVFSNPVPPGVNKIGSPGLPWGFEARIVDRDGVELPAGEPGEVWLRGDGMTQGYYNDPVGTAAAFDAAGWLHTGDLAYRDADGYFFVIGRSKELIIKGGVNIAPKQIDEILETHPAVLEAAAVGVPDRYVGEDLVAFAVLRDGMRCDELELLSFCESHLGYFKTPTRVYFVADLPKGPSGKVQRLRLVEEAERLAATSALKGRSGGGAAVPAAEEASADGLPLEQIITEIWAELLASPQIDPDSNFFALGGQSLQAIQCLSRLREHTQILLSLADFFENPSVVQLAAFVRRRLAHQTAQPSDSADPSQVDLQPIPARDPGLPCPLSPAQERIWFMEQVKAGEPAYNEAEAVRLKGKLDVAALERAFNLMIERHEILRTTIEARDGEPITVIHESFPLQFKQISLLQLEPSRRDAALARLLSDEPRRSYRFEAEPAVRVTIVAMDDDEHAVILMMHHIICDSASLGILWRELATLYGACLKGEPSPLPPLPIQYGDYAVWQRQPRQQDCFAEDIAFWKEKLRAAPPLLDQPTDRPRPPVFSFRGIKRQFTFDAALADDLRRLCRQHQTSLFTVFAAALNTVMQRYTGQDDILIGIPIAARERPELRPLIGFLVDTHVLRTDLSGDPTFRALMAKVQQNVATVYSHRAAPFDQVVSALQPARNPGYSPLIQVVLNWRDRDDQPQFIGLAGMETEALLAQPKIAKFDLTLTLTDTGTEIALEIEYNTDLFNEDRIERFVGHLNRLLEGVIANVEQRLSALPLLTDSERDLMVQRWNDTAREFPAESGIDQLFEQQAERTPEAVALVFEGRKLTYADLNARANRLAHLLIERGVKPNERVVTLLERSIDLIVAQLAILKAGAAYVPLDPQAPSMRHAWIVEDCTACLIIADARSEFSFIPAVPVLRLGGDGNEAVEMIAANPDRPGSSRRVAYVMYTSGSTGTPKGVLVPHRAVARLVMNNEYAVIGADDRVAFAANPAFDASTFELWAPLLNGGTVVVIRHETVLTPRAFIRTLQEERINVLWLTVGLFNQLAEALEPIFAQFKVLITGGDVLDPRVMARVWSNPLKRPQLLLSGYGPTETTTFATTYRIGSRPDESASVPIGRPISNTRIYLLDAQGEPVPLGAVGEIYIGGAGVALGYLNRPELTAERFLIDRFSGDPDARLYRTGDLARYLPDGNLMFIGRNDNQVKIRGFRIELGEIEGRLSEHPAVREVVVLALAKEGGKELVAYVVADHDDQLASRLRAHLAARLPDYMVPAAYVRLDVLPLTPNGKLDRKVLPAPEVDAYTSRDYEAPQGKTEILLAAIWADMLKIEHVGRHDNFFDLGGHSLLAVRIIGEINKALKVHLTIPTFYRNPTIKEVAEFLEQKGHVRSEARVVPLQSGNTGLPLYFIGARPQEHRIAKFIGADRAVFAIDIPLPIDWHHTIDAADQVAVPTIEELGALYAEVLCAHAGSSPCVVAGYSFAGKIMFEAARALQRSGGNVAFVIFVDAHASVWETSTREQLKRSLHWIWQNAVAGTESGVHYSKTMSALLGNYWHLLCWLFGRTPQMVKNRLNKLPDADLSGYFDKDGMPIPMTVVGQLAYLSARSWNPQSLDTSGVLLRVNLPEEILPGYDFTKGWGALLTQGVKIIQVAGDHISMVNDENVVALAGKISELLDQKAVSQNFSVDNSDEDVEWENADITNNYG